MHCCSNAQSCISNQRKSIGNKRNKRFVTQTLQTLTLTCQNPYPLWRVSVRGRLLCPSLGMLSHWHSQLPMIMITPCTHILHPDWMALLWPLLQPLLWSLLWPLSHPLFVPVVVLPHSDITDLGDHTLTLFLLLHTHAFLWHLAILGHMFSHMYYISERWLSKIITFGINLIPGFLLL